jgi:hypothetical protein
MLRKIENDNILNQAIRQKVLIAAKENVSLRGALINTISACIDHQRGECAHVMRACYSNWHLVWMLIDHYDDASG